MCPELKTQGSKLTAKTKASATGGGLCCFRLRLLRGGLAAGSFGFAGVRFVELAAEALDAAGGVDQLLLAGEEGVAGGADFDDDVALVRGAGLKGRSAGAFDVNISVLREIFTSNAPAERPLRPAPRTRATSSSKSAPPATPSSPASRS